MHLKITQRSKHVIFELKIRSCADWNNNFTCHKNVMAHTQKPDFVFWQNGRVHLNRRGHQFSRLLAVKVSASAVVMVVMPDTPCSEVVWRVLATQSICQFPLHFPSRVPHRVPSHLNRTVPHVNVTTSNRPSLTVSHDLLDIFGVKFWHLSLWCRLPVLLDTDTLLLVYGLRCCRRRPLLCGYLCSPSSCHLG